MTAPAPSLTVASDRYELRTLLGRRGVCSTYLALDRETRAAVAVKEIAVSGFESSLAARLEDALERLGPLEHPRIPRFLAVVRYEREGGPRVALVQQYIKGKTLAQHVAEGRRFMAGEVLRLAKGVAEALAYLHARRPPLIHGSIEPKHVLLDAYDSPYLIDFGVVERALEEAGVPTGPGGGPPSGYVPFEQFAGRPVPASDVYSLGMTLSFALTRREPIEQAAAWDRARIDPGEGGDLRSLIEGMTAPSWEQRWQTGSALLRAIPVDEPARVVIPRLLGLPIAVAIACRLLAHYLVAHYGPVAQDPLPLGSSFASARAPVRIAPLFRGDAAEAAKSLIGSEHESGQVAWEQVSGRPLVFLQGSSIGHPAAFRASDGTLAVVEYGRVLVGRPEAWRRRIPENIECHGRRVAIDEYENVWLQTSCGLYRYDALWHKVSGPGPFGPAAAVDPEGIEWRLAGDGEIHFNGGLPPIRLDRTPTLIAHDHEGRVWLANSSGGVSVYERRQLLYGASP